MTQAINPSLIYRQTMSIKTISFVSHSSEEKKNLKKKMNKLEHCEKKHPKCRIHSNLNN